MKIRITRDTGIPLVDAGRVLMFAESHTGYVTKRSISSTTAGIRWESAPKIAK